jgi:hypothetical protein
VKVPSVCTAFVCMAVALCVAGDTPARAQSVEEYIPEEGLVPRRPLSFVVYTPADVTTTKRPDGKSEPHLRLGAGLDLSWVPKLDPGGGHVRPIDWLRPSIALAYTYGNFGDFDHGGSNLEGGGALRIVPAVPSLEFGMHWYLGGGFVWSMSDGRGAARFGTGLGLQALRALLIEAGPAFLFALDRPFVPADARGGRPSYPGVLGVHAALGLDLCSVGGFCGERPASKPAIEDRTCCLYLAACATATRLDRALPASEQAARHAQLCDLVQEALDPVQHPVPDDRSSTFVLLDLLKQRVVAQDRSAFAALASYHDGLVAWLTGRRAIARASAQNGRTLATTWLYAPYPNDLRIWLGCRRAYVKDNAGEFRWYDGNASSGDDVVETPLSCEGTDRSRCALEGHAIDVRSCAPNAR